MINSGQHSFKLTEVMGNCPKFPSIVGKWGKYSHVHCAAHLRGRVTSEKNLGILTGKRDQIFHASRAFPVLPVQQLLLFKQWKHFHHFLSSWNSASWTARDGQEADLGPWNDSRLNTSGHRETGKPVRLRQWQRGDGSQLHTVMGEHSDFPCKR